jgi:hypothetical protein
MNTQYLMDFFVRTRLFLVPGGGLWFVMASYASRHRRIRRSMSSLAREMFRPYLLT